MATAAPYLLGVLFAISSLYGVNRTEIVDTDAARHAMNGAFLYDLVRTGHISHPIEYAWAYYGHLPALSMPFHPPLFPAIEAVFFSIFGVSLFTARLAVAICAGVSAFLLYKLTRATLGRPILAAAVTVTTFSSWTFQFAGRDVMLEFPALMFTLAALYCLRDYPNTYPMRRAIPFALCAVAAVWTKQHAVFLGAVPFVDSFLSRRWRSFLAPWLWISSAVFGAGVIALISISRRFHGTGVDQISTNKGAIYYIFTSTLPSYFHWILDDLVGLPGLLLLAGAAVYFAGWRRSNGEKPRLTLYWAWILALAALLVDLGPISPRYLFFMLPAVAAIGFGVLFYGSSRLIGERRTSWIAGAFAVAFFIAGRTVPFDFLRGLGDAARVAVDGQATRILYVGYGDGNFIFAARTLDPNLRTTVIPAMKLANKSLQSGDLGAFCRRYGIQRVVVENTPVPLPLPWSGFKDKLPEIAKLERSIPLQSTRFRWKHGTIDVYRLPEAPGAPGEVLHLPVPRIDANIPMRL